MKLLFIRWIVTMALSVAVSLTACESVPNNGEGVYGKRSSQDDWPEGFPRPEDLPDPNRNREGKRAPPSSDRAPQHERTLRKGRFIPNQRMEVCQMRVSNAPKTDRNGYIYAYAPYVLTEGVLPIVQKPLNSGCLSSGFGPRGRRLHQGIDISAPRGTKVYSAAPGRILEAGWAGGYGNSIIIDHGRGVYTRYAHLQAFAKGIKPGKRVGAGWHIGGVGNSSTERIGVHLHYEILVGNYRNPKKAYGLKAKNPFAYKAVRSSR